MAQAQLGLPPLLHIHCEVHQALKIGHPVVALESTIIAHGLPHPENIRTALLLESEVRNNGAIPATIAVLQGIPTIGLNSAQLQHLATAKHISKLALRDLPKCYADRRDGATTVSATMHLAHRAGIHVFATGGIGGVHRAVSHSWDISADIPALARFPVLVVSAGAKSILDIPKTLEALETASVPVLVLDAKQFPAFYTRDSGCKAPAIVRSPAHAAAVFHSIVGTLGTGALLAVPVPKRHEADVSVVRDAIEHALKELSVKRTNDQVTPSQVTPFLLKRVAQLSKGKSLVANVQLAQNNARVAAQIAVEFTARSPMIEIQSQTSSSIKTKDSPPRVVAVVGAAVLDIIAQPKADVQRRHIRTTHLGTVSMRPGGVALNVALAAARFSQNVGVRLLSAVGDDAHSRALSVLLQNITSDDESLDVEAPFIQGRRGAVISIAHDGSRDLLTGVADTEGLFGNSEKPLYKEWGPKLHDALRGVKMVVVDANLCIEDIEQVVKAARLINADLWLEPTSVAKSTRFVQAGVMGYARFMSPNEAEVMAMAQALNGGRGMEDGHDDSGGSKRMFEAATREILSWCKEWRSGKGLKKKQTILVTRGAKGISRFQAGAWDGKILRTDFKVRRLTGDEIKSTTGAGDCFVGCCAGLMASGASEDDAVWLGLAAAEASCKSEECVPTVNRGGVGHSNVGRAKL